MKRHKTMFFALAAIFTFIVSTGLTAHAQEQPMNLSDSQVLQIQALLSAQTTEMRSLHTNVQAARETLTAAVSAGDSVRTAMAVLSLDAAEKAVKIMQSKNQRNLLSLLNTTQKQQIETSGNKSVRTSD